MLWWRGNERTRKKMRAGKTEDAEPAQARSYSINEERREEGRREEVEERRKKKKKEEEEEEAEKEVEGKGPS